MSGNVDHHVRWGARLISFLLIFGGLLGAALAIPLIHSFYLQGEWSRAIVPILSIPVFAWSAWKGIDLWRGLDSGYRWATILFVLQIPQICIARLTYEFSTGLSARILFGNSTHHIGANIGSSLNVLISAEPLGWMFGINLVAVAAVAYLLVVSRRASARLSDKYPRSSEAHNPQFGQ
jgi:hypothetical protein